MTRGQSLIEVLVAVAIGTILILGVIAALSPALRSNKDTEKTQMGAALGRELMENVRVYAENDWHKIEAVPTTSQKQYYLNTGKSPFLLATGSEAILSGSLSGLVAYWKMDEGTATSVADFAGSYPGTVYNDFSWTTGKVGNALTSGGSTAQMVAANSPSLRYQGGDMSVSLWVKPDATDDGGWLFSKPWNGSGQYNYYLTSSGGANPALNLQFSGATSFSLGSPIITAGSWHHIGVTISASSSVYLYVDGKLAVSGTSTIVSWTPSLGDSNANFVLGCIYPYASANCAGSTVYDFKGSLDDVRVYNRALSVSEMRDLYNAYAFTRYFYLDDVYRNTASGKISNSGSYDPSTKKVTVEWSWPGAATTSLIRYITRSRNYVFTQTDWSGGGGQSTATTSVGNRYDAASDTETTTTPGSFDIPLPQ